MIETRIVLTLLFVIGVGLFATVVILYSAPAPEINAIELVANNYIGIDWTTGDAIELEVRNLNAQGLPARARWDSVNNGAGLYVVTAYLELRDPFTGWEELYSMRWRVNLDTKEIAALDNTARLYSGER